MVQHGFDMSHAVCKFMLPARLTSRLNKVCLCVYVEREDVIV